jgi:hypothetical protein
VQSSRRITAAGAVVAVVTSFAAGQLSGIRAATASASHVYTLRQGDKIRVPSINQTCTVSGEGSSPDLFCARPSRSRHQVVFFRDEILVWTNGNPDKPAWSGRP